MTPDYRAAPRQTNESAIARERIAAGMTQAQLAEAIGTSKQVLSRWETGQRSPTVDTIRRIADALHIDTARLL